MKKFLIILMVALAGLSLSGQVYASSGLGPFVASSVDVDDHDVYGVYVSGSYAYVADGDNGLSIIDISDPTSPQIVGSIEVVGYSYDVYVSGSYAYLACYTSGFKIIDISDPTSPQVVGSVDTTGYSYGVYVSGSYAYVADGNDGLKIIDISDPASPQIVGSVNSSSYARSVYVSGSYAYVAVEGNGLEVIDISDPTSPQVVGTVDTVGYARDVYVSDSYAYVADYTSGLQIVDVSNPSFPKIAGSVDTYSANSVYVSGNYAYVADGWLGLRIVDISREVTESPPIIDSFTATPTEGIAPLTVNFTCLAHDPDGGTIPSIEWFFGDSLYPYYTFYGTFSKTHTYVTPGTYLAYCRVWDDEENNVSSAYITITVGASEIYHQLVVTVSPGEGGTVESDLEGIECPDGCSAQFLEDTEVTLTAIPEEDFQFAGWGGDCEGCGNDLTCVISMGSDKNCTASFNQIPNEPPVIDSFTVTPDEGVAPLTVTFTCEASDSDGIIEGYEFDFGDGSAPISSSVDTVTYTYGTAGQFYATCKAYDDDEASVTSAPVTITVSEPGPSWQDITDGVKVEHSLRPLYDRINRCFFVYLTLTNDSGSALIGPVLMILDSSTIPLLDDGSKPGLDPDGYTDDGKPYFVIVPEGAIWLAGKSLEVIRLDFSLMRKPLDFELLFVNQILTPIEH